MVNFFRFDYRSRFPMCSSNKVAVVDFQVGHSSNRAYHPHCRNFTAKQCARAKLHLQDFLSEL